MLIEVKVKVARIVDGKTKKRTETYLVADCELFSNAEYRVMSSLIHEQEEGTVSSSEIVSLRQSPIKEICEETMPGSAFTFIATLRDIFHDDDGNEKSLRYKVLLWANDLSQANERAHHLVHQGYNMQIEGIKEVEYEYLVEQSNQEEETESESQ
jgi:hypothetical protein